MPKFLRALTSGLNVKMKGRAWVLGILLTSPLFLQAQSVGTPTVSPTALCAGTSVQVAFSVENGNPSTGYYSVNTVYYFYLSDANGSFVAPTMIGSAYLPGAYNSTNNATISGLYHDMIIPAGTPNGTGYRISVSSTAPNYNASTGVNKSLPFSISNTPPPDNAGPDQTIFIGQSAQIGAAATTGHSYSWTSNPAGLISNSNAPIVNPTSNTTYTLQETSCPTASNGTATHSVTIFVTDRLTISKTLIGTPPTKPGDLVTYQISYVNFNNTAIAQNVVVTDILPSSTYFTFVSSTPAASPVSNVLTWNLGNIPAQTAGTITVTGRIGSLGTNFGYDPTSYYISSGGSTQAIVNSASIQNAITPALSSAASTSITQSCGISMPASLTGLIHTSTGANVFYFLEVENTGNIKDRFTLTNNTPTQTGVTLTSVITNLAGDVITQTPWLSPGEKYGFLVQFTTPGGTPPDLVNHTFIRAISNVCGTIATTDIQTTVYNGTQANGCDLLLTKTASASSVVAGTNITYTVTVRNLSGNNGKDVIINDTLPASLNYISSSQTGGASITWNAASRVLRATRSGNFGFTDEIVLTILAETKCSTVPSVTNSATVTNNNADNNQANNVGTVAVTVTPNVADPVATSALICSGAGTTISLASPGAGRDYKWYSAASGGTLLQTNGNTYATGNLAASTTYYVTQYNTNPSATDCESNRVPIVVTVVSAPTVTSQPLSYAGCGTSASFTYLVAGTPLAFQWQESSNAGVSWSNLSEAGLYTGTTTQTLNISAIAGLNGRQYRCLVNSYTCYNLTSNVATLTVKPTNTWIGVTSNWNDVQNWCPAVPGTTTDVTIPVVAGGIYPVISSGQTAYCRNITIASGAAAVTINNGGTLQTYGNIFTNGTLNNDGTLHLRGAVAISFPGTGTVSAMNNLFIENAAGVTLNNSISISGELRPTSGTLALGNYNITLLSSLSSTAHVSAIAAGAGFTYGTGRFVVERYINTGLGHERSWQLLSSPAIGQSVYDSWQEAGNLVTGYGTQITGPNPGAASGIDNYTVNSSLLKYNATSMLFDYITNTVSAPVYNPKGYFMFIRGDRTSIVTSTYQPPAVPTILRSTGTIHQPSSPPASVNVAANQFETVGNPYPAPINLETMFNTAGIWNNLAQSVIVWDPSMYGYYATGGYQTISKVLNYMPTPGGTSIYSAATAMKHIQSGQAFFVQATASAGSIVFNENIKSSTVTMVNFAPGQQNNPGVTAARAPVQRPSNGNATFRASLYRVNGNIADGNGVGFNDEYSNEIDANDARKISNSGEVFSIRRNNKILAVEARSIIRQTDTIFYELNNLQRSTYQFRFAVENLQDEGLEAVLVDTYLKNKTSISLRDSSVVDFMITADPASSSAGRFYVVFRKKSARNNNPANDRSESLVKKTQANVSDELASTSVYPNPVVNGKITLQFSNKPAGKYGVTITNSFGQVIMNTSINVDELNTSKTLQLPAKIITGQYQIKLVDRNGRSESFQVLVK